MRIIRHSVFETNSSSTHSLSLGNGLALCDTLELPTNDANEVVVELGEFGWGYETLYLQSMKLSYLLTMVAMTEINKETIPEHVSPIEFYRSTDGFKTLNDFVQKYGYAGISTEKIGIQWKSYQSDGRYLDISGHIDHQSCEGYASLQSFLNAEEVTVEKLLMDKDSKIIIDNDND